MVSEICVPQSLDPIFAKFDEFLAHGQVHMGQMGNWPWQCTTTGLDNSTELRTVKIHQAVTEIWVPQVWQPPARPDRDDNTPPARRAEGQKGNQMVMTVTTVSSLAAPAVVRMQSSSAASEEKVVNLTTFWFQWIRTISCIVRPYSPEELRIPIHVYHYLTLIYMPLSVFRVISNILSNFTLVLLRSVMKSR